MTKLQSKGSWCRSLQGFWYGHKAVHVVDSEQQRDHLQRLAAAGIDLAAAHRSGQPELRTNTEVYLRDGRFDQDRMFSVFEQLASGNAQRNFPLSPIYCRMDWAACDQSLIERRDGVRGTGELRVAAARRCGHLHRSS